LTADHFLFFSGLSVKDNVFIKFCQLQESDGTQNMPRGTRTLESWRFSSVNSGIRFQPLEFSQSKSHMKGQHSFLVGLHHTFSSQMNRFEVISVFQSALNGENALPGTSRTGEDVINTAFGVDFLQVSHQHLNFSAVHKLFAISGLAEIS
jgi:hypothetical protein